MALQEEIEIQGNWLFKNRSLLPIIILIIGLGVYLEEHIITGRFIVFIHPYEHYFELSCLAVSLLGQLIRIFTVGYTPKNTSGRNVKGQLAESLNTSGIYSTVRHPLYVGNFLMWLGPALLTGNFWFIVAFCLAFWVYYERIMYAEEQFLRKKFGEKYLQWADNIPAFIPNFRHFRKPTLPFSWKKILKKEKNGFFATFAIFLIFNYLGMVVMHHNWTAITVTNKLFLWGTAITGLLYFILKYLKNNTKILNESGR